MAMRPMCCVAVASKVRSVSGSSEAVGRWVALPAPQRWRVGEEQRVEGCSLGELGESDEVLDIGERVWVALRRRHDASWWPVLMMNVLRRKGRVTPTPARMGPPMT